MLIVSKEQQIKLYAYVLIFDANSVTSILHSLLGITDSILFPMLFLSIEFVLISNIKKETY